MDKAKNLDEFIKSLEGKSPREVNKEIRDSIPKNMLLMLNMLPEIKKRNESLKRDFPEVNKLIKELRLFFEELEKDGIIKIERNLFDSSIKEAQKEGDERDSGIKSFSRVKKRKVIV